MMILSLFLFIFDVAASQKKKPFFTRQIHNPPFLSLSKKKHHRDFICAVSSWAGVCTMKKTVYNFLMLTNVSFTFNSHSHVHMSISFHYCKTHKQKWKSFFFSIRVQSNINKTTMYLITKSDGLHLMNSEYVFTIFSIS